MSATMVNIQDLKQFLTHQYSRNLVMKSENVEIIIVCWKPGQASPIHGHGPSDGIIVVLEGELSYTNYFPDSRKVSGVCKPGDVCHTPVGVDHEISNKSSDDLVTLHIYAPPLNPELQGFDLGYNNEVRLEEVQLPQDTIRYLMASIPQVQDEGYHYTI